MSDEDEEISFAILFIISAVRGFLRVFVFESFRFVLSTILERNSSLSGLFEELRPGTK